MCTCSALDALVFWLTLTIIGVATVSILPILHWWDRWQGRGR